MKIKLVSRYNDNNYLEQVGDNKYLLISELDHIRIGHRDDEIYFVDPPGGPFMSKGDPIEELNGKILESIKYEKGKGFILTVV